MNGPQHYQEAERDIARADDARIDDGLAGYVLARAQVHATLALTAAVVEIAASRFPGDCRRDWYEVVQ